MQFAKLAAFPYPPKPYERDTLIETLKDAYDARLRKKFAADEAHMQAILSAGHAESPLAILRTCVTSVAAVGTYQVLGVFHPAQSIAPDWPLGLLFGAGGVAGMYLGARWQKYAYSRAIKWMLSVTILVIAGKYLLDLRLPWALQP